MAETDGQERTEQATSKRLEDARKEGQVVRSRELSVLLSLLGSGFALFWTGPALIDSLKKALTSSLGFDAARLHSPDSLSEQLVESGVQVMLTLTPFLGVICLLSLVGPVLLGGWSFNGSLMLPKLERLDPLQGIVRMFSLKSVMELVKAIIKVTLVGAVAFAIIGKSLDKVILLPLGDIAGALGG
ncbi:MAG TPA: EscU/YscU/HrcU family type III secretion system export apparatus switch protein, partial [Candidatus Acidoferrum sp.]|nr:EscU/YscU/HrcU family type III secretion system export apparatus switch protein [Candidatus Acidoferrum sp.]